MRTQKNGGGHQGGQCGASRLLPSLANETMSSLSEHATIRCRRRSPRPAAYEKTGPERGCDFSGGLYWNVVVFHCLPRKASNGRRPRCTYPELQRWAAMTLRQTAAAKPPVTFLTPTPLQHLYPSDHVSLEKGSDCADERK